MEQEEENTTLEDGQGKPIRNEAAIDAVLNELSSLLRRLPAPEDLSPVQKDKERKQHRDRLKALNAVPRSDWHREFENLLQIEVEAWNNGTVINREVSIGEDAPRADFILVRGNRLPDHVKSVFLVFRKNNAIEYKRPTEVLTERMVWKTAGYGNLLIGTGFGSFDKNEFTLSIFAYRKNEKQFAAMLASGLVAITEVRGIYRVNGMTPLPFQIVIVSELEGLEYAAYRALSDHTEVQDVCVILDAMKTCSI